MAAHPDKVRKYLTWVMWLQGILPVEKKVKASQKNIAVWIEGKCGIPTKKSQVAHILRSDWPFGPPALISKPFKQLILDTLAYERVQGGIMLDGGKLPDWIFSATPPDGEPIEIGPLHITGAKRSVREFCRGAINDPGRDGAKFRPDTKTPGILRDSNVGVVQLCEATSILDSDEYADAGDWRCRTARKFYEMRLGSLVSPMGSISLEQTGDSTVTSGKWPTEHNAECSKWINRLINNLKFNNASWVYSLLDHCFVEENRDWIDRESVKSQVCLALDIAAECVGEVDPNVFHKMYPTEESRVPFIKSAHISGWEPEELIS